jgi:hypothetical protein
MAGWRQSGEVCHRTDLPRQARKLEVEKNVLNQESIVVIRLLAGSTAWTAVGRESFRSLQGKVDMPSKPDGRPKQVFFTAQELLSGHGAQSGLFLLVLCCGGPWGGVVYDSIVCVSTWYRPIAESKRPQQPWKLAASLITHLLWHQ